jgi:DNA-binding beta-propeller fold protein YncE
VTVATALRRNVRGAALALAGLVHLSSCAEPEPATATWPENRVPIRGEAPLAYISDNGSDTVSVVSLRTMTRIARVPVGLDIVQREAPHHLVAAPDLDALFVGLSNVLPSGLAGIHADHGGGGLPSYVERRRLSDLAPDGWVRVDTNLGELIRVPGTTRFVSSHFDLGRALDTVREGRPLDEARASLVVIDGVSMSRLAVVPVCVAPHGAVVTEDGLVAVACYGEDAVALVDVSADPPVLRARVPVGVAAEPTVPPRYGPFAMALSPDGARVFVGLTDERAFRVLDLARAAMMPGMVADAPGAAFFGAFSPDGTTFYGPTQQTDALVALDTATLAMHASVTFDPAVCVAPHVVVHVPAIDALALVCEGDHEAPGTLVTLDPVTLEVRDVVEVGVYPDGISLVDEVDW